MAGRSGLTHCRVQPPDAENRMSGGVGGSRRAIAVTRPDRRQCGPPRLTLTLTLTLTLNLYRCLTNQERNRERWERNGFPGEGSFQRTHRREILGC
jgi:hypothetical protein